MAEKVNISFGYSLIFISLAFWMLFYISLQSFLMLNPGLEKEGRPKYADFNHFLNNSLQKYEYLTKKKATRKIIIMLVDSLRYDCM